MGNAAKVAPPAVMSHTSLPFQTGPMAARATFAVRLVPARNVPQHARAEIEAVEHEIDGPEEAPENEPQCLQRHAVPPSFLDLVCVLGQKEDIHSREAAIDDDEAR